VTTLTISAEQKEMAERRIADAGVAGQVEVLLRDYRDAEGTYDAVVSVEMIEAVGEEYWPTYFGTINRLLRPRGRVGLQAITMPHDRMVATRRSYKTLHEWRTRFLDGWDRVAAAGFDPVFRRMWDFYLSYCEAGFRSGYLDAWQVGMVKP
jgi:cyclopropane-fatty-acyl-phospholipid synthase